MLNNEPGGRPQRTVIRGHLSKHSVLSGGTECYYTQSDGGLLRNIYHHSVWLNDKGKKYGNKKKEKKKVCSLVEIFALIYESRFHFIFKYEKNSNVLVLVVTKDKTLSFSN